MLLITTHYTSVHGQWGVCIGGREIGRAVDGSRYLCIPHSQNALTTRRVIRWRSRGSGGIRGRSGQTRRGVSVHRVPWLSVKYEAEMGNVSHVVTNITPYRRHAGQSFFRAMRHRGLHFVSACYTAYPRIVLFQYALPLTSQLRRRDKASWPIAVKVTGRHDRLIFLYRAHARRGEGRGPPPPSGGQYSSQKSR